MPWSIRRRAYGAVIVVNGFAEAQWRQNRSVEHLLMPSGSAYLPPLDGFLVDGVMELS